MQPAKTPAHPPDATRRRRIPPRRAGIRSTTASAPIALSVAAPKATPRCTAVAPRASRWSAPNDTSASSMSVHKTPAPHQRMAVRSPPRSGPAASSSEEGAGCGNRGPPRTSTACTSATAAATTNAALHPDPMSANPASNRGAARSPID